MNFDNYIFRSHMVGKIIDVPKTLTDNQSKTLTDLTAKGYTNLTTSQEKTFVSLQNKLHESNKFKLSEGTKKTLSQLAFTERYGRRTEINSDKLTKGIEVEKNSRDILSRVSDLFLTSCTDRKSNDWVTGLIDIHPEDVIIDIKSSWSWESFCSILQTKPNEIYLRQGDSYMDLWNKNEFLLCHVLTDTPSRLVERELKSYDYKHNILNMEGEVREDSIPEVFKLVSNHIFSRQALEEFCNESSVVRIEWFKDFKEIEEKDRVHMISHSFQKERIEQRNECIKLSREYMNNAVPMNNFQPELIR